MAVVYTYKEPVFKFRVMRQLNDSARNPLGTWTLVYSSNDRADAEDVMQDMQETWKRAGDHFRIVEGEETVIERSMW